MQLTQATVDWLKILTVAVFLLCVREKTLAFEVRAVQLQLPSHFLMALVEISTLIVGDAWSVGGRTMDVLNVLELLDGFLYAMIYSVLGWDTWLLDHIGIVFYGDHAASIEELTFQWAASNNLARSYFLTHVEPVWGFLLL